MNDKQKTDAGEGTPEVEVTLEVTAPITQESPDEDILVDSRERPFRLGKSLLGVDAREERYRLDNGDQ